MKKTTVYFSDETSVALKELGRRMGRAQADLIRAAVDEYIARQERPWPTSFGMANSGKVSGAESEDWLKEHWKRDW